jgi:thiamine-phosphate pyrophosphorylase
MFLFKFYLITDDAGSRHKPALVLPQLAEAGLRALQVREKQRSPLAQADYAAHLLAVLGERRAGLWLFLNDRADLALSLGLDGVHLRNDSLPLERHAPALRQALLYGVSTHSLAGARAAEAAGADFITFGPVYDTPSKAGYGKPVGLHALEAVARATRVPIFALGGVTPQRARECLSAGAHGVSAISAVWNAPEPVEALLAFRDALGAL